MQLQIECNNLLRSQECCLCRRSFECQEARVIVCNDQGSECGDACPDCINQGFGWIKNRFEQLNGPKTVVRNYQRKPQGVPIGA